ncbi:hypothetical protein BOX15_Mlig000677g6 [Macrostomum lignano]|uniref:CS domain-containing protein n=2 Tax=Macrostomum lignano TaxID=282301 RepID=A0A1I8FCT3_9PLAT|nr:hypothetical protein BOX15_Mlig000677g6 [Macrostomum lignano]
MANSGASEFSVVDINDEQPKKGVCTVFLSDAGVKKKSKSELKLTADSVHVTVQADADKSLEFRVKKLPGEIVEGSTKLKLSDGKVTLTIKKKEAKSWAAYASDNLECGD